MVGAIILLCISFFIIGLIVACKISNRAKAKRIMEGALTQCETLWNKDNPEKKWYPNLEYETGCDIMMTLLNPEMHPVMDTGCGTQCNAQIIGWLIDQIKKDPVKWYNNFTLH